MAFLLGVGAVLYILLVAGCAAYLLWKAYALPPGVPQSDFEKLAVAALIAVVGTGLTGLASVYSATRQSATAYQVAEYNGVISTALAGMKENIDASLAQFKAASDESSPDLKSHSTPDRLHIVSFSVMRRSIFMLCDQRHLSDGTTKASRLRKLG